MLYDLRISHMGTGADQRKNDECWLLKEVLGYNECEIDKIINSDTQMIARNLTAEQIHKIAPCFYNYDINAYALKGGIEELVALRDIDGYNQNLYNKVKKSHYYDTPVIGPENREDLTKPPKPIPIRSESIFPKHVPKCPICDSEDLSKITTTKKVAKIALFGIFGMGDNGKTWRCNNCGSKF